jgi:hypothetical protein
MRKYIKKIVREGVKCIYQAQDTVQWRDLANKVMKLRALKMRAISWLPDRLSACHEGLRSMNLVWAIIARRHYSVISVKLETYLILCKGITDSETTEACNKMSTTYLEKKRKQRLVNVFHQERVPALSILKRHPRNLRTTDNVTGNTIQHDSSDKPLTYTQSK